MKALLVAGVCLFSLTQLPAGLIAQERPPIIDMHLHADLPSYEIPAGAPALCRPEPCQGEGQATASHDETFEQTLRASATISSRAWSVASISTSSQSGFAQNPTYPSVRRSC
jgi:hypothetical protein